MTQMKTQKSRAAHMLICLGLLFWLGMTAWAQETEPLYEEKYLLPPPDVQAILVQDKHIDTLNNLSPDKEHLLIPVQGEFSSLQLMTQRTLRLGMLEICPDVNRAWRLSTSGIQKLKLYSLDKKQSREMDVPKNAFVSDTVWSPDGQQIAFLAHLPHGTQVWVGDVRTGKSRSLSKDWAMATLAVGRGYGRSSPPSQMLQWTPDGGVLTLLVPPNRGPEPKPHAVPQTPLIRHTRKKASPTSTYPFLLRTPHDQELFRFFTTSQIAFLKSGEKPVLIGEPAMYMSIALSPDGKYILAEKLVNPFSYIVSYSSFPKELVVMDLIGTILSTIRELPLQEGSSRGDSRPTADLPRDVSWRPDGKGLSLLWKEPKKKDDAQDEEEENQQDRKDRIMLLTPPFDLKDAQILITSLKQFSSVSYAQSGHYVFAQMSGRGEDCRTGTDIAAYDLTPAEPQKIMLLADIKTEDPTQLPGSIMTRATSNGVDHALTSSGDQAVYLQGPGYKENFKPQPFIDRVEIGSAKKERIFEGSEDMYEQPLVQLDRDLEAMIISRESLTEFPNSFLWEQGGSLLKLTQNQNPFPRVADCRRENFEFTRRDGLKIQAQIALPPGYQDGQRVPGVFWTYPREFGSFKEYTRAAIRSRNINRFPRMSTRNASDIWLTQGYAVVTPDIPIIGKGNAFNNNFIAHLVDSMYAAIRKVDALGYVDVDRLGHGGHSYGAFATANILARTPFFKAGIAGDGAYNRTLTPMAFQSERRFIWEAQDVYLEMSPIFQADHLDTPLLMYHGGEDNNTGTFLIQSERMIQALTGLGKTAVLYIYPFESHGPRCLETYQDMWARWLSWFNVYVKQAEPN
jgi:dipeptidyl aminopeptidase/acylaminoacyl peptidase